jgi:cytochrome b
MTQTHLVDHLKTAQCSVEPSALSSFSQREKDQQPPPLESEGGRPVQKDAEKKAQRETVWDRPTRVFHGLLILTISGLLGTAYWGGEAMIWHIRLAYGLMGLLTFRLIWGFVGGYWSRWRRAREAWFPRLDPSTGQDTPLQPIRGHSRSGWASIFLFWGLILTQLATGLVADDQIATSGPLVAWVNENTSHWATIYHRDKGSMALWAWLGIHISAVLYYDIWRHQGIIGAMWHGEKSDLK